MPKSLPTEVEIYSRASGSSSLIQFVGMACNVEFSYSLDALPISGAGLRTLLPRSGVGLGLPPVFWGS